MKPLVKHTIRKTKDGLLIVNIKNHEELYKLMDSEWAWMDFLILVPKAISRVRGDKCKLEWELQGKYSKTIVSPRMDSSDRYILWAVQDFLQSKTLSLDEIFYLCKRVYERIEYEK